MTGLHFDADTALRIIGFIYVVMPATVWTVLRGSHPTTSLLAWCGGTAACGAAMVMNSVRTTWPDLVYPAQLLVFASYPLRVAALDLESGLRPRWLLLGAGLAAVFATYLAASAVSPSLRVLCGFVVHVVASFWLAWAARRLWRQAGLGSARLIAGAFGALSVSIGLLVVAMVVRGQPINIPNDAWVTMLAAAVGTVAVMVSCIGYLGLANERVHRAELLRADELAHLRAHRESAELHAGRLQQWLAERDQLLKLLAQEVRQPLNSAMDALHGAHQALVPPSSGSSTAAGARLQRAEDVLVHLVGTLDNTLAATAMLVGPEPMQPRDSDVDTVVALSVGDLAPAARARVRVQRLSAVRTAVMDAGLMRLALRNLLDNAMISSPPDSPVQLCVSDLEEPRALVFEVVDTGPGVPPELRPRLFKRGERGRSDRRGHGLGLYVVRRVMELHGGSADVSPDQSAGTRFRLLLPRAGAAASA